MLGLCLVIAASASAQERMLTVGLGTGIEYGGIGTKITLLGNSNLGLTAGVGYHPRPILSLGMVTGEGVDEYYDFDSDTFKGLGFSLGLDLWWSGVTYSSVQIVKTGNYRGHGVNLPLYGINLTLIGGQVGLGGGFFANFAGNMAFLVPNSKNPPVSGGSGLLLGVSVGIGCVFGL